MIRHESIMFDFFFYLLNFFKFFFIHSGFHFKPFRNWLRMRLEPETQHVMSTWFAAGPVAIERTGFECNWCVIGSIKVKRWSDLTSCLSILRTKDSQQFVDLPDQMDNLLVCKFSNWRCDKLCCFHKQSFPSRIAHSFSELNSTEFCLDLNKAFSESIDVVIEFLILFPPAPSDLELWNVFFLLICFEIALQRKQLRIRKMNKCKLNVASPLSATERLVSQWFFRRANTPVPSHLSI